MTVRLIHAAFALTVAGIVVTRELLEKCVLSEVEQRSYEKQGDSGR